MSTSFNSKQIDQILSENDGFLRAIQEFQSMGKVSEVIEFQKRLQLNLLQMVDTVSAQFKSTKENPNSVPVPSASISMIRSLASISKSGSHESLSNTESQESKRRKRTSFTDMPKI